MKYKDKWEQELYEVYLPLKKKFEKHFPDWRVFAFLPGFSITSRQEVPSRGSINIPLCFMKELLEKLDEKSEPNNSR